MKTLSNNISFGDTSDVDIGVFKNHHNRLLGSGEGSVLNITYIDPDTGVFDTKNSSFSNLVVRGGTHINPELLHNGQFVGNGNEAINIKQYDKCGHINATTHTGHINIEDTIFPLHHTINITDNDHLRLSIRHSTLDDTDIITDSATIGHLSIYGCSMLDTTLYVNNKSDNGMVEIKLNEIFYQSVNIIHNPNKPTKILFGLGHHIGERPSVPIAPIPPSIDELMECVHIIKTNESTTTIEETKRNSGSGIARTLYRKTQWNALRTYIDIDDIIAKRIHNLSTLYNTPIVEIAKHFPMVINRIREKPHIFRLFDIEESKSE